ncbi:YeeE/YedE family protein [Roseateles sp.]|uniref:YeeE/YedE family protein n=1 Tax=Roseateles sp. TaxID=1971397 RepID=UPI0025E3E318|nr:YeeE/YedE family protein [Roseateles sp.]MBV8037666.1 YeeE/YedE family protein [Roseateles sp.]
MDESSLPALTHQVLGAAFGLTVLFGALCQRTRFCTMGAVSDIYAMGDWRRARMWMLAVAVAMLGFNGLAALGLVDPAASIYTGPRLLWLSGLLGGLLFGFGMVLGSGCISRNLVRLGGGNLKSLVVLVVAAVAAGATLRGLTAVLRVATVEKVFVELPAGQALPSLLAGGLPGSPLAWGLGIAVMAAAALMGWALLPREGRTAEIVLAGLGVGLLISALWWVSGHLGFLPEDPRTLEPLYLATNSRHMESLSTIAPVAYALDWLLMFSDQSKTLTLGIVSVAGIVVGAALMAWRDRSFRWEGFGSVGDLGLHLAGAVCMGVGGIVAMGCSIGQGVTGVSTLSLGSFIVLAAMVAGAWLGLRYQDWRLARA